MSKQNAVEAYSIYENFVQQCQGIDKFMTLCRVRLDLCVSPANQAHQTSGIFQGRHIPDLTQVNTMYLLQHGLTRLSRHQLSYCQL